MDPRRFTSRWRVVGLVAALLLGAGFAPSTGRAGLARTCPTSAHGAYWMTVTALTGPTATDVALKFDAAEGCPDVTTVKTLQVVAFSKNGRADQVRRVDGATTADGVIRLTLGRVARGRRIEADAVVENGSPPRSYAVEGGTRALLRPNLRVVVVNAPLQTLTTRPVAVAAEIEETNGDTGATAQVSIGAPMSLVDPVRVTVPPGGHAWVRFQDVPLASPVSVKLRVSVADATPEEYDAARPTDDSSTTTVDVTANELNPARLVLASLGGYGFQFNGHLSAPITSPPPETLPGLEAKVKALEPQLVRIFFNENWELNADGTHSEWRANIESFAKAVALAQKSGATILIAYQGVAQAKTDPELWMERFAGVLKGLIRDRKLTNVRWVTIGNEPNSGGVTLEQYDDMYRVLDGQLRLKGLRSHIGLVGGDLVQNAEGSPNGHRAWFDYMTTKMNDVLDAWSEHVYWWYYDPSRMEERLKDIAHLVRQELPAAARKPTFLTEYGVRGYDTCGTKPKVSAAYYKDADCTELRRTSLAGFQKLWFTIEAAQLGFDGAANWDLYWSVYDRTKANQSYWTIGPPQEGWPLYPSYYAFQLLLQTTAPGWHVLGVDPWLPEDEAESVVGRAQNPSSWIWDKPEQELVAFAGRSGQFTLAGLDTHGRSLTAPDGESSAYSIGGLPPYTTFTLAEWDATGDGTNSVAGKVTTNAVGVARFEVPMQAAFVLTTVPVA